MKTRWLKVFIDIYSERNKLLIVIIAIFFGVLGSGMILDCLSVTKREMRKSYLETNPAAFSIRVKSIDDALLDNLKENIQIKDIEVREMVRSRVKVGDECKLLQLYIIDDFNNVKINQFIRNEGSMIPESGEILWEENSMELAKVENHDDVIIKIPFQEQVQVHTVGSVRDTGLKPAWMEEVIYGYITRDYLQELGGSVDFPEIFFTTRGILTKEEISTFASQMRQYIVEQGYQVTRTTVFEPGEHPNAGSMNAILFLFELFGIISLLLSCILVVNLITAIIKKQTKQIAIMKAIGASTIQITVMYLVFVLLLGLAATIFAIPLAVGMSRFLVEINAFLLNFTVSSMAIPFHIYFIQICAGITLPCIVSIIPIYQVTKKPARDSLSSIGLSTEKTAKQNILLQMKPSVLLGFKNTFRRRGRFLFITATLAGACLMLMTAMNLRKSAIYTFDRAIELKNYDIQFLLNKEYPKEEVSKIVQQNADVKNAEYLEGCMASFQYDDYRNSNSFQLIATTQSCVEMGLELEEGNWLSEGKNEIVLNQMLQNDENTSIGEEVDLVVQGVIKPFTVVGFVREIGSGSIGYVNKQDYCTNFQKEGIRAINITIGTSINANLNVSRF